MRAEILLLVLALLVTIIGVNTDSTGKMLKYKGIRSVKVGKKTYKCSFNIAYTATACIKKTATVKCRPKTNKLTLKFPQIDADDATLDVTVFKNKIKTCKVASGSTMIPTIPAVTTTVPPQGECPCNGDMQSMRDTIADLMTKFENHETFIKENAAAIANHETEIKENTAAINTKCNETTCSAVKTTIANHETCLGDVSSADCPPSPDGKTGIVAAIQENTEALANKCDAENETLLQPKTVLVMGPDPWITVSLPDFAPASSNCSIPVLDVSEGRTTYGQTIDGKLYICDQDKCSKYDIDSNTWELQPGMKFQTARAFAYSTWIPGANPQWVVQGGYLASAYDWLDSADVWTPETRNWKLDPIYKSPLASWAHCVVALNNKVLQIGGNIAHGVQTNRVFLDDVELASMGTNRQYHACLLYNEKVWVAAGYNRKGYGSVEIYDDKTNRWTDGPTIPVNSLETSGKLREIEGQLYYLGNQAGKIFKIENNMWKEVATIPKGKGHANGHFFAEVVQTKC